MVMCEAEPLMDPVLPFPQTSPYCCKCFPTISSLATASSSGFLVPVTTESKLEKHAFQSSKFSGEQQTHNETTEQQCDRLYVRAGQGKDAHPSVQG